MNGRQTSNKDADGMKSKADPTAALLEQQPGIAIISIRRVLAL